jgi:tetratricopeptide (TPR) repeat protein
LAVPIISFLLICSLAPKQNGLRYILPIFPFLCLAGGAWVRAKYRYARIGVIALLAWMVLEAVSICPNDLAYFNELVGGPKNGYQWLVDSNLDWGQDFARLGNFLRREQNPETIIACLGTGDRDYYFGPHQDLLAWSDTRDDYFHHLNSSAPKREFLIVSASFLQGFGLSDPSIFFWLHSLKPLAQPGYSTFVFDVTADPLSQFNIGKIYMRTGRFDFAVRQFQRAVDLAPDNPFPLLALGDAYAAKKLDIEASQAYASSMKMANSAHYNVLRQYIQDRIRELHKDHRRSA